MREARVASAAALANWVPYLVCIGPVRYDPAVDFKGHVMLKNQIDLVLASWLFPGRLVHVFVLRGDHAVVFCKLKNSPVVLDLYDTCSGWTSTPAQSVLMERAAIGAADAITHRDLRIRFLERFHGYRVPKKGILLHDPLPARIETDVRPPDDAIHVVSVGWIDGEGDGSILRTAVLLTRAGIHLHIYLNHLQHFGAKEIQPYVLLAQQTPFLHLESPLYGAAYWEALSRNHFGLSVNERSLFGEDYTAYTRDYLEGCGSSRISDYIRSDLGVISSPGLRFQNFWARHYAPVVVNATREFLLNPLPALRAALAIKARRPAKNVSSITAEGAASRLNLLYRRVLGLRN
jgi:hypothetical protein